MNTTYQYIPAHLNMNLGNDIYVPDNVAIEDIASPCVRVVPQSLKDNISKFSKKYDYILENKPMAGFKILGNLAFDKTKETTNTTPDVIFVQDPRGHRFTLFPSQLVALLANNSIHNMEILQPCVYAGVKGKKQLMLIPYGESSQSELAVDNKAKLSVKHAWADVPIGASVELDDFTTGYYYGIHNLYHSDCVAVTRSHIVQDKKTKKCYAHNTSSRYVINYDSTDVTTNPLPDVFNPSVYGRTGYRTLDKTKKEKYKIDIVLKAYPVGAYVPYGEDLYFISDNQLYCVRKTYNYRSGDSHSKPRMISGGITADLVSTLTASYESTKMLSSAVADWCAASIDDPKAKIPKTLMCMEKKISIIK